MRKTICKYSSKILLVIFLITLHSYSPPTKIAFYHWKAQVEYTPRIDSTLKTCQTNKVYLRLFDIKMVDEGHKNKGLFPQYIIRNIDTAYQQLVVTPVIYITNNSMSKMASAQDLSKRIIQLTKEILDHHGIKNNGKIQLDCDWSGSTREKYFDLIREIKKTLEVSVTLRLHQIKYPQKTGVPPVSHGCLMLYNMGELDNMEENSILGQGIINNYLSNKTSYPIGMDLALPLFSQTVILNNKKKIKLINRAVEDELKENDKYFSLGKANQYTVIKDTLFYGFFLSKGFQLKIEKVNSTQLINAVQSVKNTKLHINDLVFYHLDDKILEQYNFTRLIDSL